jgi:hypothetical protein
MTERRILSFRSWFLRTTKKVRPLKSDLAHTWSSFYVSGVETLMAYGSIPTDQCMCFKNKPIIILVDDHDRLLKHTIWVRTIYASLV